ncbi:MAG TPA: type 4a pilus biogenesis protein PilO [Terriglobia bacterium]|nr:type 4a pilus biogenesis protein PilO [Terriglobia bacterium]
MAKGFKDFPPIAQAGIIAALAAVLVGVVSYMYVFPLFQTRADLSDQVAKLTAENKVNEAFEQKQTEYRNRIAQLETQLETLRSIVPDEAATDEFMKTIFNTANAASIHVRTFVAAPLVNKDYYVEMPFNIHLDGTYWSLVNYFDRLAHEQRIISVTSISLGPPLGGGMGAFEVSPTETVAANCIVTAYFNSTQSAGATAKTKK